MARIAFYTFAILRQQQGHEQVQGFFDRTGAAFAQAEQSAGFIDRSRNDWGSYVPPRFFDEHKHALDLVTLSLWTDLESVCAFAYRGIHGEAFKKRRDWLVKPEWPTYVAWWVNDDQTPTREEACQRLEYIHDHDSSAHAFNFKQPFDEYGQPTELDRDLLQLRMKSNETRMA